MANQTQLLPHFQYTATHLLPHKGDCALMGICPDMTLYVEEMYGDGWMAQHTLRRDGTIMTSRDEHSGSTPIQEWLALPADAHPRQPVRSTLTLNYGGPRHRGMRDSERITDMARPFTLQTRFYLIQKMGLDIAPAALLGVAESYVLAEALLQAPDLYLVCRRLRVAYALAETRHDSQNQPYDYDTFLLYTVHLYNRARDDVELPVAEVMTGLPGVDLHRPMDCLVYNGMVFVAEGGEGTRPNAVHLWQIASNG